LILIIALNVIKELSIELFIYDENIFNDLISKWINLEDIIIFFYNLQNKNSKLKLLLSLLVIYQLQMI
jgi:hypothetical protein